MPAAELLLVRRRMTFTALLSLIAFTAPVIVSLGTGWKAGRGFGLLIGLVVGLAFGVGSFWGLRVFAKWISRHPNLSTAHPGAVWISLSWLLCAAVFVCIGGVSLLGLLFTNFVIHHVCA